MITSVSRYAGRVPAMVRVFIQVMAIALPAGMTSAKEPPRSADAYRAELNDLYELQDYRPGKTSFVLGLETHSGRPRLLNTGDRTTVLDIEGVGSLRHIWETHGDIDPAPFRFEMFVDGEREPSIHGRLPELIRAAQRSDQWLVMNPGSHVAKSSFNWYLPVPFEKSLRVDVVLTGDPTLLFMQLDYRTDDRSLVGTRLLQKGEGQDMALAYHSRGPHPVSVIKELPETSPVDLTLKKGERHAIEGPAVIRRLAVPIFAEGDRLRIWFDGAATPAVDVDLADFFGLYVGTAFDSRACYLPMPFRREARIAISGGSDTWPVQLAIEEIDAFQEDWGYFHAKHQQENPTLGYRPFQNLYVRGRGQFVGLSLYDSHHDHGGGDFAVVDGESADPIFIHGINGEDYFSFSYFGKGKNPPYSEAFTNEEGRFRLHLENPYPFARSLQLSFGTVAGIAPRSVALWYQAEPQDTTIAIDDLPGLAWQVFGPVDVPVLDDGNTPDVSDVDKLFARLPSPQQLDAGETHKATRYIGEPLEGEQAGWATQRAVGPHLNLMYVERHTTMPGDPHMSYAARAMMARTTLTSEREQTVTLQLSYDDPILVMLNDEILHQDMTLRRGFTTQRLEATLRAGENRLLARMVDTPNINTCWAALNLRILDADGREISDRLQPQEAGR